MTQFRDLVLSSESFRREAQALNDRLDAYASQRLGNTSEGSLYYFSRNPSGTFTGDDVARLGNDTVEFVHRLMWEAAKPVRGHNYRRYQGNLADILNGTFDLYSKDAAFGLGKAVSVGLHKSGRIRNSGKAIRGALDVRVRPLEESFEFITVFSGKPWAKEPFKPTRRDEADIRRQQQKAKDQAGLVNTTVDPAIIPLPDPNPESVMEYVTKLTVANKALAKKAEEATTKMREALVAASALRDELGELKEKAERRESEAKWSTVVDGIAALGKEG